MLNDIVIAIIAGLIGTSIMTSMMLLGKQIGLPAIDVHSLLGYVTREDRRTSIGYIGHWVLGGLFAIPYVLLFHAISANILVLGAVFGIVHWLLVGGLFAFAPVIHAGMR